MLVKCIDNSGIISGKIIKVFGSSNRKKIIIGDRVLIVVKSINLKEKFLEKKRQRKRFRIGSMHRALVVQTKFKFKRFNNTFIEFFDNAVIIVNKKTMPIAKRIKGIIILEIARKYLKVGSISTRII